MGNISNIGQHRAHVHAPFGGAIPCDYSGAVAFLTDAEAYDTCEVCVCGVCRYSSYVGGVLEKQGEWDPVRDPDVLRGIYEGALEAAREAAKLLLPANPSFEELKAHAVAMAELAAAGDVEAAASCERERAALRAELQRRWVARGLEARARRRARARGLR